MQIVLQSIIGTDSRNPHYSVLKDKNKNELYIYFGNALIEKVPDIKDSPQIKHLIGRLYNANVKAKGLTDHFGYSFQTIKRWGDAIKSGNMEDIYRAFEGQGAPKKLTKEIESFIIHEFDYIYPQNKYSYSKEIREDIKKVFKVEISSETLRPLFKRMKEEFKRKETELIKKF
jgi:transposase